MSDGFGWSTQEDNRFFETFCKLLLVKKYIDFLFKTFTYVTYYKHQRNCVKNIGCIQGLVLIFICDVSHSFSVRFQHVVCALISLCLLTNKYTMFFHFSILFVDILFDCEHTILLFIALLVYECTSYVFSLASSYL